MKSSKESPISNSNIINNLINFFGFSLNSSRYLFVLKQITIQRTERTVQYHVETCQFHSLLGMKKVVTQAITFDSTAHHMMSPFLTAGMHNIV